MIELLVLLVAGGSAFAEDLGLRGFQVGGDVSCPSAAQVTQSLTRLHPDLDMRGWRLELSTDAGTSDLQMRVHDPSNALVGERRFIGLLDCNQRADAVAATLAVWLGELTAQPAPIPFDPPTTIEQPPVSGPPSPGSLAASHDAAPTVPTHRWQLELGAAALGSIDETGAGTPGIDLSARAGPLPGHWGWQAHLGWEAPRTLPLGPGFADWQRITLAAGPHFQLQRGWRGFDLEADLLAGVIVTHGGGVAVPHLDAGLEPGFFVGGRFFADPRPIWRGWLSVGLAVWPVREQVGLFSGNASIPTTLATIPQLELLLALGGSWLD